ncbi:hypothetical protein TGP89_418540 [Toxoplasma gondii p89]|uniref:Uncharacterized protein n=1 Tax=Toxoplasma gondii p89 TaxID=943119 RepID=A0A086L2F9_TOXGO|nr:hypothetical protein TGP89_418540 [Toxoplasma gondii p89]
MIHGNADTRGSTVFVAMHVGRVFTRNDRLPKLYVDSDEDQQSRETSSQTMSVSLTSGQRRAHVKRRRKRRLEKTCSTNSQTEIDAYVHTHMYPWMSIRHCDVHA